MCGTRQRENLYSNRNHYCNFIAVLASGSLHFISEYKVDKTLHYVVDAEVHQLEVNGPAIVGYLENFKLFSFLSKASFLAITLIRSILFFCVLETTRDGFRERGTL